MNKVKNICKKNVNILLKKNLHCRINMKVGVVMTKGDIYTKEIFQKILDKGCLDKDPRPHYEDIYEGAIYDIDTNTIITKEHRRLRYKHYKAEKRKNRCRHLYQSKRRLNRRGN